MLKAALIVGSTRQSADTPVRWHVEGASARSDLQLDVLDLRESRLPFFDEPVPPLFTGGSYTQPEAEAWRRRIGDSERRLPSWDQSSRPIIAFIPGNRAILAMWVWRPA